MIANYDNYLFKYLQLGNFIVLFHTTKVANSETISFSSHHQKVNPKFLTERKTSD